jgi:hypothetical protein
VKIYVTAVEALRKKERQDETQFTTKIELTQFKLHTDHLERKEGLKLHAFWNVLLTHFQQMGCCSLLLLSK